MASKNRILSLLACSLCIALLASEADGAAIIENQTATVGVIFFSLVCTHGHTFVQ
jgi:hypothetical protein